MATRSAPAWCRSGSCVANAPPTAVIDPPGFALESFDVIGGWREQYRTTGNGDRKDVIVDGRRMPYRMGLKVDPSDVMPDGSKFKNIDEFNAKQKDIAVKTLAVPYDAYADKITASVTPNSWRSAISPGISVSAIRISARPNSARAISAIT